VLDNVRFLPRQPLSAIGGVLALGDVLLVHLRNDPLFRITIPSKTQAYMASQKPVLMAVAGDAAQLVLESGGGLVCEPEDPAAIAETLARFFAMSSAQRAGMGAAGKTYYDRHLSLKAGVDKFEAVFAKICGVPLAALGDAGSSRHAS
jgi:glycosyltransferase involved in cell wall biosynthesis